MAKFEELIEELKKEIEEWKRVTDERIQETNQILEKLAELVENELDLHEADLDMFDYDGFGFRCVRKGKYQNDRKVMLLSLKKNHIFPPEYQKVGKSAEELYVKWFSLKHTYEGSYMNLHEINDFIQKLPAFIENFRNVLKQDRELKMQL